MPKRKLTANAVDALSTTQTQEDFWDALTPNLVLRVSGTTGRKTWLIRYRSNGTHRRMKIGTYPGLSLKEARDKARDELAKADAGGDPAQERKERQERRQVHMFKDLAEEVLEAKARKTRSGKPSSEATKKERRRIVDTELLPVWGDRPVSEITRRDVVQLVEGIARRAPVLANRVLTLINTIFNTGLRRGFETLEANPAHMVEAPGVEQGRDRYLTATEIKAVWQATEYEPDLTRGAFRLALLTGQRIGSVLAMRRDLIDGDVWTIPEEDFKGKRPHLVPLADQALNVLSRIPIIVGAESFVFPSRAGASKAHLTNLSKALIRIRENSRIPHWTLHDFRTTFRTHAVRSPDDDGLGVPAYAADAVLGHKEPSLGFGRYTGDKSRYMLAEKRDALKRWGAFVRLAVEGEPDE